MEEGYDGTELIKIPQNYLPENSTVLDLGIGPGKDLDILKELYIVTGSDNSKSEYSLTKIDQTFNQIILI